ncbi:MAG: FAD-binding protein [Lachnospiraceae bacterium]|nr:FAD-binding protein [Lachnospiraceae bacterium]
MANKEISRRTFIKGIAAGAVSLGAVGVINALGTEPAAPAATEVETTTTSTVIPEEIKKAASGLTFTPGTYEATAKGIASDVKVTMTFDETMITDCKIDVSGETKDIGGKIGDKMAQAIVNAQSCDVDAVAGATVTSDAIKKAAADCMSQASGTEVVVGGTTSGEEKKADSDWLGEAPEIADKDITETIDTEVVVVGCGTGGWIAAMSAAEAGAKVLVVEKRENPTGIREDIGAIDSKIQIEEIAKYPELKIDKMEALQDLVRYGAGYVDSNLIKVWINESAEMVDWLTDLMESTGDWYMSLEGGVGNVNDPGRDKAYATGHSPHKTEEGAKKEDLSTNSTFRDYCDKYGVEWKLSTALVKLVQDDAGKVTGLIAQDVNDEHYIKINASKGVIMTAGGYATNTQMMQALQPQTLAMKANFRIGSVCDGSGIKAMMWAGAALHPIHASMMFNRCCVLPTETAGYETTGEWFWFGEQPFLKVNLNGERFCNESGPYEFMLHSMYMQPYHTYCDIFDANNKEYCEQFDEVGCCRLFAFPNGALSNRDYDSCWASNEDLIEKGYIVKADTLEELAEGLGIPADQFVETVKRYNELCAKGVDEDYGKEKHRMTPVDTAPFYGVRTCAWHLTTLSGCRINTDMQVIREDGTPIEGLYASGDCTGGMFGDTYPNLFTGLACGRTMTFARRAAKIVAAK